MIYINQNLSTYAPPPILFCNPQASFSLSPPCPFFPSALIVKAIYTHTRIHVNPKQPHHLHTPPFFIETVSSSFADYLNDFGIMMKSCIDAEI